MTITTSPTILPFPRPAARAETSDVATVAPLVGPAPPAVLAPPPPAGHPVARAVLGAGIALVTGPAYALARGVTGAVEAGWDCAGVREGDGPGASVARLAVTTGALLGAVGGGVVGGPGGALVGLLVGPGAVGALLASARGAVDGVVEGARQADVLGRKAGAATSRRFGRFLGAVARVATTVASGLATVPAFAVAHAVVDGVRGVARAVGVTASNSDTVASGAKGIILATGAAFGMAASASLPALPLGFIGGAGGAASAWVAVREGARGLAEGVTFGFQAADALTAPAVAR